MAFLEVSKAHAGYGGRDIIKGADISAERGELICLAGPNGSGKTTLLKVISGLLRPGKGSVKIGVNDISEIGREQTARLVSFVPQLIQPVPGITVRDLIKLGRTAYRSGPLSSDPGLHKAVSLASERTGVAGLLDRDISQISGGEFQRALIARSIAQDTGVILLDEPVAHLDIKFQKDIMDLLVSLTDKLVIATFHDLSLAARYAKRVVLMKDGVIVNDGEMAGLKGSGVISSVYGVDESLIF